MLDDFENGKLNDDLKNKKINDTKKHIIITLKNFSKKINNFNRSFSPDDPRWKRSAINI